ncbi:MAG: ChaN family lipoprotein [Rhodosalinus sp.]|uniref:ChaN family lipoprotein n=1 Tax=Rhodosalinus sp. TaxID=2047741 RepID=UPI00397A315D
MRGALAALALPLLAALGAEAEPIAPSELSTLPTADIVILGEVHDNPWHHENQTAAVAELQPAALVFEMLTPEYAERVTPDLMTDAEALRATLDWDESGWPDFAMYAPIFAAAPEARVFGAAVPREELRGVVMGEGELPEDAARWGLDAALPDEQQAEREAMQAEAHCDALPETMLPGMVMAQRVRDAALARKALRALDETGGPVVVITGNGHARTDWGMPAKLARAAPDVSVLSVGQLEAAPEDSAPYDLWLVTPEAERPDPCDAFRG